MAWSLPRLLRRLRPALAHFQYSLPLAVPVPGGRDRARPVVRARPGVDGPARPLRLPHGRAARRAPRRARLRRLRADAARPRRALRDAAGEDRPHAERRRSRVHARAASATATCSSSARSRSARTRSPPPTRRRRSGMPLVVAGPEKEPALARELERRGAQLRGYVDKPQLAELYRGAACLVLPSRYEGFGLPVLEAMACGTPVVAADDAALREVGGDAAVYAEPTTASPTASAGRSPKPSSARAPASSARGCSRGRRPRGARSRRTARCSRRDARRRRRRLARRCRTSCARRCPRSRRRWTSSS